MREQTVFPEIVADEIKKVQGMHITIVTTAAADDEARDFLRLMGMPFAAVGTDTK
jgi:large subunit ribosomal protein L5